MRRSAGPLAKHWSRLGTGEKAPFDGVLLALADQIDVAARFALAERLAELRLGPPRTSRRLAIDRSADVAAPLLMRCRSLGDEFLAQVAAERDVPHRLAIGARRHLSSEAADLLAELGSDEVAVALLDNPDAAFSAAGIAALMRRAVSSEAVTLKLAARPDLPDAFLARLAVLSHERAVDSLKREFGGDGLRIEALHREVGVVLSEIASPERLARISASHAFARARFSRSLPSTGQIES